MAERNRSDGAGAGKEKEEVSYASIKVFRGTW
jgi:hypothetical protein